jgi:hypothetical protein
MPSMTVEPWRKIHDTNPILTLDLFAAVAHDYSRSAAIWLDQLGNISLQEVKELFSQIPPSRISPTALEFGYKLLEINRSRLLHLRGDLA